ncbi:hypothetical protein HP548_02500 [Paenibacillus taichungensis]|uniref:Uncharacterized protein n=1 Tax=Paenibacillus taichungensis TaxID=484184 RepID=A0ABX2ME57_9BACL|nr:hypothetical protein [Paenibacillus taichungensis]NUU52965.1 hypothetical protein [Paenibacillus taichungensis]
MIKHITVDGRISLPKELQELYQMDADTELILSTGEENIIMTVRNNRCILCGSTDNTVIFKAHKVCKTCVENVKKEARLIPKPTKVTYEGYLPPKVRDYHKLLLSHPGLKQEEAAKILGVSQARISKMKIKLMEIKDFLGME